MAIENMISYWLAVNGVSGEEYEQIFHNKPQRSVNGSKTWHDYKTSDRIQEIAENWMGDNDYSIVLPKGTIKKIIGKELSWKDNPVEIKIDLDNYINIYQE